MALPVSLAALTTLPPRTGAAFTLAAGETLSIVDLEGEQVADLVAFAAADPREALSNGRTFDYEETIALTTGNALWSNRSRRLLTIVHDDVGTHDFLLTPCSRDTWRICYGGEHDDVPGCFGNLAVALASYGIAPDAIPTTFNVFMHVRLAPDRRLHVAAPRSKAGDRFAVRAEHDLIVGLTACSAARSNNGRCTAIGYRVDASAG
jgi:uncharacterized protein YcgI (DUF1989 family)